MATVADLIVRRLRDAGVRAIFGVPGGGSNLDVIAAAENSGLPFVLTSTETGGAIAALAQAEVTGCPAACLTTLGPGAASVVTGVACAFLDRAPVVVFTDSHAGSFEHQRIDQAALLGSITKSSESLTAGNALQALTRALHAATDGRPGPVHLDCPGGIAAAQTATTGATLVGTVRPALLPADRAALEALVGRARKPLLLVGLGARQREDVAAIRELCGRRQIPAMVTYKAKGVVPDMDAWFAGVFTNAAIEKPVIDQSDLLIGIGLDPVELIPRAWTYPQPIIYVGRSRVDATHVPFALQIVTDVRAGAGLIDDALSASDWDAGAVRDLVQEQRTGIEAAVEGPGRDRLEGMSAQRIVRHAASRLAEHAARVTVDAGAHMFPATMIWPVHEPNGMLISNGLSTMGFAVPAAIGAALLDRERPVVALTGDGGLLMCAGELLTAVRERLRVITIVFNDASLSLIGIKQQARGLAACGVALGATDWCRLAGAFGVAAWPAADEAELDRAFDNALASPGPSLIDVKVDRRNYGVMLRAVRGDRG